jgi:hypothetical protein
MNDWIQRNIFNVLDVFKFIGIVALVLMFIHFNAVVADNARSTKAEATSTNQIVRSQGEILDAIKQLAIDNRVNSDEKTNIIICMLRVPVSQRTTDVLNNCRVQQVPSMTTPNTPTSSSSSPSSTPATSSSQTTPSTQDATPSHPQTLLKSLKDLLNKL